MSDALREEIKPLLPSGPPRLPDRAALVGIILVTQIGTPWELLPPEINCGAGMTRWRRLRDWHKAGVWDLLHQVPLQRLADATHLNRNLVAVDSCSVPGIAKGGEKTGLGLVNLTPPPTQEAARRQGLRPRSLPAALRWRRIFPHVARRGQDSS